MGLDKSFSCLHDKALECSSINIVTVTAVMRAHCSVSSGKGMWLQHHLVLHPLFEELLFHIQL